MPPSLYLDATFHVVAEALDLQEARPIVAEQRLAALEDAALAPSTSILTTSTRCKPRSTNSSSSVLTDTLSQGWWRLGSEGGRERACSEAAASEHAVALVAREAARDAALSALRGRDERAGDDGGVHSEARVEAERGL